MSDEVALPQSAVRYSNQQMRRARDLLARLYAARRAARFYPPEHPVASQSVVQLLSCVRAYHDEGVDIHLAFHEGEIVFGDQILLEESVMYEQLVRDMTAIGAGALTIRQGVSEQEVAGMVSALADDPDASAATSKRSQATEHVTISAIAGIDRIEQPEEPKEAAEAAYGGAVSLLREVDRLLRDNSQVPAAKVKSTVRSLVDNVLSNRYSMLHLAGLKNYDEYTFYHSANVAILSLALGSAVTSDYRFLSSLGVGALLHDIGKLSVELGILNKPGSLTSQEWQAMQRHPVMGAQMVASMPGVDKAAMVAILEHHMRYDSTGYPKRTTPKRQHLASRIIAVADTYDAMTSKRSYSAARVQDEAMALLAKNAGVSLDPVLVRLFIELLGVYPPRSVVRLSSGEIGVVVQPNTPDPFRPIVRVIATSSGDLVEPHDIDLMKETETSVSGCIDARHVNIDVDDFV